MKTVVLKFGGTSVGSVDRIKKVAKIILSHKKRKNHVIVASSAMSGVTNDLINKAKLNTVCQSASCPNIGECWDRGHATVMILGDVCTRKCGFCNIKSGNPNAVDVLEPKRLATAISKLKPVEDTVRVVPPVTAAEIPDALRAVSISFSLGFQ